MKRFESLYNQWLDGQLDPEAEKAVRRKLGGDEAAEAERALHATACELLRENAAAAHPPHPEFINTSVLERIQRDDPLPVRSRPVRGFALAGGLLTAAAIVLTAVILPQVNRPLTTEPLVTQLIEARTTEPGVYASTFRTPDGEGVVIWLEGVQYIPGSRQIQ